MFYYVLMSIKECVCFLEVQQPLLQLRAELRVEENVLKVSQSGAVQLANIYMYAGR